MTNAVNFMSMSSICRQINVDAYLPVEVGTEEEPISNPGPNYVHIFLDRGQDGTEDPTFTIHTIEQLALQSSGDPYKDVFMGFIVILTYYAAINDVSTVLNELSTIRAEIESAETTEGVFEISPNQSISGLELVWGATGFDQVCQTDNHIGEDPVPLAKTALEHVVWLGMLMVGMNDDDLLTVIYAMNAKYREFIATMQANTPPPPQVN